MATKQSKTKPNTSTDHDLLNDLSGHERVLESDNSRLWKRWHWGLAFGIIATLILVIWSYLNFLCATTQLSDNKDANWLLSLFYGDRCNKGGLSGINLPNAGSSDNDKQELTLNGTSLSIAGGNTIDLTSLAGTPGPQGPAGANGSNTGLNGTNGTNGANGAAGPAGPAGPSGPNVITNVLTLNQATGATSTVNGVSGNQAINNAAPNNLIGFDGVGNPVYDSIGNILNLNTTNTLVNDGVNTLTSTVNGVADSDIIINNNVLAWTQAGGLSSTVNGVNGTQAIPGGTALNLISYDAAGNVVYESVSSVVGNNAITSINGETGPAITINSTGPISTTTLANTITLGLTPCAAAETYVYNGAAWVCTSAPLPYTFQNGLTESPAGTVELGGANALLHDTDIASGGFDLTFDSAGAGGQFAVGGATVPGKVAAFYGDVNITGVIDPTAILFSDQVPSSYNPAATNGFKIGTTGGINRPIYVSNFANSNDTFQVRRADDTTVVMDVDTINQSVGVKGQAGAYSLTVYDPNTQGIVLTGDGDVLYNMNRTATGSVFTMRNNSTTMMHLNSNNGTPLAFAAVAGAPTTASQMILDTNGNLTLGSTDSQAQPSASTYRQTIRTWDGNTSAILPSLLLYRDVTGFGAGASGIGTSLDFQTKGDDGNTGIAGRVVAVFDDAGATGVNNPEGSIRLNTSVSGIDTEGLRVVSEIFATGSGAGTNTGIGGITSPWAQLTVGGTGAGGNAGIQWEGVASAPALSTAGDGRIYYNSTSNQFECSINGGAYSTCVTGGAGINIYNTSSSFTSDRTATMAGFDLTFDGSSQDITISDDGSLLVNTTTPVAGKVAVFNGDIDVTGIIDPYAVQFSGAGISGGYQLGVVAGATQRPIYVSPDVNSTDTFQVRRADDTTVVMDVDTSNRRVGINTSAPGYTIHAVTTETSGLGMLFDASTMTTGTGARFAFDGLTTGTGLNVTSSANHTGIVTHIQNQFATSTGTALVVTNGSLGNGFRVNDDGTTTDVTAFVIDPSGNTGIQASNPVATLHNGGSMLLETTNLGDYPTGGNIGGAAATVDVEASFNIAQTTASQTISLPAPSNVNAGRIVRIQNTGSTSFTMGGLTVGTSQFIDMVWNGTAWVTQVAATGGGSYCPVDTTNVVCNNGNTLSGSLTIGTNDSFGLNLETNGTTRADIDTTGNFNLAISTNAYQLNNQNILWHDGDISNLFVGVNAGNASVGSSGNTLIGNGAGDSLSGGPGGNTAIGFNALTNATNGQQNTAVGDNALTDVTTGDFNVGIGDGAGANISTGTSNIAIGATSGNGISTSDFNIAIGTGSLGSAGVGSNNTAMGINTFNGFTGSGSVAIGNQAGSSAGGGTNLTFVGYQAGDTSSGGLTNSTVIGYNAQVTASNSLILGGTAADAVNVGIGTTAPTATLDVVSTATTTNAAQVVANSLTSGNALNLTSTSAGRTGAAGTAGVGVLSVNGTGSDAEVVSFTDSTNTCTGNPGASMVFTCTSDASLKTNVEDSPEILTALNQIKVRSYDWLSDGTHASYGVIAQELEQTKLGDLVHTNADTGIKSVTQIDSWMLVKGLQEVDKKVEENQFYLLAQLADQQSEIDGIKSYVGQTDTTTNTPTSDFSSLSARLDKLEARNTQATEASTSQNTQSVATAVFNGGVVTGDVEFQGQAVFAAAATFHSTAVFKGDATFEGDVKIAGNLSVGDNTAGVVTIPAGAKSMHVTYSSAHGKKPVVTVSPNSLIEGNYAATNQNTSGFDIVLEKSQTQSASFSWTAIEK